MPASRGLLRVVSPDELTRAQAEADAAKVAAEDAAKQAKDWTTNLGSFIEGEYERFQRHRDGASGWSDRLMQAMRTFKGEYDPTTLREIQRFGGSQIYSRITATKCRGASSLLRDVYLNTEKPWGLEPTPEPSLPDNVIVAIQNLISVEVQDNARMGIPTDPQAIRDRAIGLIGGAKQAAVKKARKEAETAQAKLDDLLVEGQFYQALSDFLVDLPLFPFACIKGPVVRIVPQVVWEAQRAVIKNVPKMFWYRVSPFDLWWTPGVSDIAHASVIELCRLTRADLSQMLGLPGYNEEAIRQVLRDYGKGYVASTTSSSTTERAILESREDPRMNESGIIDMLEYHGYVPGRTLLDYGLTPEQVPDPDKDYFIDAYKIGQYIIKVQLSFSVRKRPPYYITSFEKVPGTVVGNALPEILNDIQDVSNASLRSLVNNMSISSGPQVVINDERIAPNEDSDDLYPWKRWHTISDPMMSNSGQKAVDFFQPGSNAQELIGVYKEFQNIADDLSAIPKYITGSDRLGGAGRTASGLAMLMGNASKILQTVAANVDGDVIYHVISELYDMVMLTDTTGLLRGDESIKVLGVTVAMQRETQRQRQLEFLQVTANPIDMQIVGPKGRSVVLRAVSDNLGLPGEDIVPPEDALPPAQPPMGGPPAGASSPGGTPGGVSGGPNGPMPQAPAGMALPSPGQAPRPQQPQGTNVIQ